MLLSADVARVESWSVDFLVIRNKLLQVVADGGGNISVLQYDKQVCGVCIGWGGGYCLMSGLGVDLERGHLRVSGEGATPAWCRKTNTCVVDKRGWVSVARDVSGTC
jgi:hypothetical protein